jgi:hypothetical protein
MRLLSCYGLGVNGYGLGLDVTDDVLYNCKLYKGGIGGFCYCQEIED